MLTILEETSNGVKTVYDIAFGLGYLDRSHVYVYSSEDVDAYQTQLTYTWISDTQIELDSPVPNGEPVKIRRVVPRNVLINDFEDGAILHERNLDGSFKQALMILQEIKDGFNAPLEEVYIRQNLSLNGYQVKDLGDPTDPGDAVSLGVLNDMLAVIAGDPAAVDAILLGIANEQAAREAADTTLQNNINTEASDRDAADTATLTAANNYTDLQVAAIANQSVRIADSVGGTANAIEVVCDPVVEALYTGLSILVIPTANNTSLSVTLKVDLLLAKNVQGVYAKGAIQLGVPALFVYDGTNFQLANPAKVEETPATQTYALDSTLTFNHGLGVVPKGYTLFMDCQASDSGYTNGERIFVAPSTDHRQTTVTDNGLTIKVTDTQCIIRTAQDAFTITNFSTGLEANIDPTKWKIGVILRA